MHEPKPILAAEICALMARHSASDVEGKAAITFALITAYVTSGVSKQSALEQFSECWDLLEQPISREWKKKYG